MELQEALTLAAGCGFDHVHPMAVEGLEFDPRVREMCAADRCRSYGRSWACPPACGSLEEIAGKAGQYARGILVQSTGTLEDDFDMEAMMDTEQLHKERFYALVKQFRRLCPDCLPMGAGTCRLCESCAYPEPCRHPELVFPSMEACGLFVSKVCQDSGMKYYYGPLTITYTACILF